MLHNAALSKYDFGPGRFNHIAPYLTHIFMLILV